MVKKQREPNANSLANLKPQFTKDNQPSFEARSKGQIARWQHRDMCKMLFEKLYNLGAFDLVTETAIEQAKDGDLKSLLELIKITKDSNNQTQIINAMQNNVQKIYVTKEQEKQANKHIDEIIDLK